MRYTVLLLLLCACNTSQRPQTLTIEITGDNYLWYTRYPGPDQTLHTADDLVQEGAITVPEQTDLTIRLTSKDLIYMFRLPELGQKQMAVPEMFFDLSFSTGAATTYEMKGDQMCGFAHRKLIIDFHVVPYQDFQRGLQEAEAKTAPSS